MAIFFFAAGRQVLPTRRSTTILFLGPAGKTVPATLNFLPTRRERTLVFALTWKLTAIRAHEETLPSTS
ncbi:MAG: hypothetical protein CMH82_16335 [Nocardioides sp.]|nr:hypothetical protein [Nocardioides sp.]